MNSRQLLEIARGAGNRILDFYGGDAGVEAKADNSPLTLADRAAHEWIVERLRELDSGIPIISEEAELPAFEVRSRWDRFWLVDPLDGTKEFLKQTGEFTVNIGLVENGVPAEGVVFAPAIDLCYWTEAGGVWKQSSGEAVKAIAAGRYEGGAPVLVASRDHAGPAVAQLLERHPDADFRSMGSSLKFCLVAEGAADIYLRDVPTMEWDTAAAHAVVNAAGATLRQADGASLAYNKTELRNPAIVTSRPGSENLL